MTFFKPCSASALTSASLLGLLCLHASALCGAAAASMADLACAKGTSGQSCGQPFYESSAAQSQPPGPLWGAFKAPLPTNRWWSNLVTGQGNETVYPLPYLVAARKQGVAVGYSSSPNVTSTAVTYGFEEHLTLGFMEASQPRVLSHFEALSAAMQWNAANGAAFEATFVRGSPYQTVAYSNLTPSISTAHTVLSVDGKLAAAGLIVKAPRIELQCNNNQTWILYASKPLELKVGLLAPSGTSLMASQPFDGVLRAALSPSPAATQVLDQYKDTWPYQGSIDYKVAADKAQLSFRYMARQLSNDNGTDVAILTCVLPHHVDAGATGLVVLKATYNTMKGPMTCLAASRVEGGMFGWDITENLTTIAFDAPRPVAAPMKAAISAALAADAGLQADDPDPYYFGKQIAAMGRVALIADSLGDVSVAAVVRGNMKKQLQPWLTGVNPSPLQYDTTYGGIATSDALADGAANFGSGLYNDHHFHRGYFIYAAAALGRKDPAWLEENKAPLDDILLDFANPSSNSSFLPFARNKDWFDGHSWASGITPFSAGKNQESSSEAVNAYYGVYLLGEARQDDALKDWGRLLLAMELRSAKKYYQIQPSGLQIYPAAFAQNGVVGILWSGLVSYKTWFGENPEFIYGIQMLPFTPISEELLVKDWLTTAYPIAAKALATAEEAWKGLIYMSHAVIDKAAAWDEVQSLTSFDDGNSRTNALWWVATRP